MNVSACSFGNYLSAFRRNRESRIEALLHDQCLELFEFDVFHLLVLDKLKILFCGR